METQNLKKLDDITRRIDDETDFNKLVELFSAGATLIKENLSGLAAARGKITEIVRDVDGYIEKELKVGANGSGGNGNSGARGEG